MKIAKTNPLGAVTRDCEMTKRSQKDQANAGVREYRGCSTTGREARPALISPSRFSHRSDRENRAGQLLSQKRAREATNNAALRDLKSAKTNPLFGIAEKWS
jgi:hypothetical protein